MKYLIWNMSRNLFWSAQKQDWAGSYYATQLDKEQIVPFKEAIMQSPIFIKEDIIVALPLINI